MHEIFMSKYKLWIPEENIVIYKLLYIIEVGLRELIIQSLEATCGSHWWKERLPADVLEKYRKGREYERTIKWCQLVPHHPIYYVDLPDLKKIIERADNWKEVFSTIFKRKEILTGTLIELEPIRNKIAHNRKATVQDQRIVEGAYHKIVAAVGEERLCKLVSKCTLAPDLRETFLHLQAEAEEAFECCMKFSPLKELRVWNEIKNKWWFDETYLGHELNSIKEYFLLLVDYSKLPRTRGSGHKIETWVKLTDLKGKYTKAREQLSKLLTDIEGG